MSQPDTHVAMKRQYDERSEDKNDSQMSKFRHSARTQNLIDELNSMYGNTKKKILELIESLKEDKRNKHEIKEIILSEVKFMSRASIYNALPEDLKRDYKKQDPKVIEYVPKRQDLSTEGPYIEEMTDGDAEIKQEDEEEAGPTPLELAEIKVAQLEDAIKKIGQFKPATKIDRVDINIPGPITDDSAFQHLRQRAKETGNILVIDRVGSGALIQALAQYKGSFKVAEVFLRIIT